jgi:hypothetical protein
MNRRIVGKAHSRRLPPCPLRPWVNNRVNNGEVGQAVKGRHTFAIQSKDEITLTEAERIQL